MELQLKIAGGLLILLALIHPVFPWYFRWKSDLAPLQLINRQVMYVHTFFIAFAVFLMGLLCLTSPVEIVGTPLGRKVALGFGIFWIFINQMQIALFGFIIGAVFHHLGRTFFSATAGKKGQ